jgi:signal transduction histidine kinase
VREASSPTPGVSSAETRGLFLSGWPATPAQRRIAEWACVLYTLGILVLLPFATSPWAPAPGATAVHSSLMLVIALASCGLLAAQFGASGERWLNLLALAYLYSAWMALAQLLTFPGAVLVDRAILPSGQAEQWLYHAWGLGFVAMLLAAIWIDGRRSTVTPERRSAVLLRGLLAVTLLVMLAVAAAVLLVELPASHRNGDRLLDSSLALNAVRSLLAITALVLLWRRRRHQTLVHLSLSLTLVACSLGPLLIDLGGAPYTFGWYAGRASFALGTGIVLLQMLIGMVRLQARLTDGMAAMREQTRLLQGEIARRELAERRLMHAQRLEAIAHLAGDVAHDFNNLLMAMRANAEILQRTSTDAHVIKLADNTFHAVMRGARLTHSLLAFGRRHSLRALALDMSQVLSRVQILTQRVVGEGLTVRVQEQAAIWPCLADSDQLEIAVLNLVLNARDAMPEGGDILILVVNLTLGDKSSVPAGVELSPGDYVAITVSDQGQGIPERLRGRVFEPFFTTKGLGEGSGLGLSQAQGFARQSGGDVGLCSEQGKGTRATIYLPRAPPGQPHPAG